MGAFQILKNNFRGHLILKATLGYASYMKPSLREEFQILEPNLGGVLV